MPPHSRVNGVNGVDSPAAQGRARQRLKLSAISYVHARHGVDATVDLAQAGLMHLCKTALEFVETLPGSLLKNRRTDLYRQGNNETLKLAAIAYVNSRHGIDADLGMSREGLALLCQAAIDFVESLPGEGPSKRSGAPMQISNGVS